MLVRVLVSILDESGRSLAAGQTVEVDAAQGKDWIGRGFAELAAPSKRTAVVRAPRRGDEQ